MGRCNNCQFENVADARACARCGQRLTTDAGGTADRDAASTLPDWMRTVPTGAGRQGEVGTAVLPAGGVAAAATLPVQVRRSRVPVLSVGGPPRGGDAVPSDLPAAEVVAAPGGAAEAPRRGNRLRMVLLIAIIVAIVIAILAHLVVHGGA